MIVDAHHHYMPESVKTDIAKYLRKNESIVASRSEPNALAVVRNGLTVWNLPPVYTNLNAQIQEMDRDQVDVAILHTGLGQEWITKDSAPTINDGMAEAMSKFPDRIVGLAHVPQLGDEGLDELDRAIKDLHLKGIAVTTHVDGIYPDSDLWQPLLSKADSLRVPIVVHAATIPHEYAALESYGRESFAWARMVGRAYDQTVFTMRVLTSGILEKYPNLIFCIAHTGGTFFGLKELYLKQSGPREKDFRKLLNRLYFDTAARSSETEIAYAIEVLRDERLVFGSDYPYFSMRDCLKLLEKVEKVGKDKITGQNAAGLFRIAETK
jgi:aminocarboxymuconate-semialdehyde decarboxylase